MVSSKGAREVSRGKPRPFILSMTAGKPNL